MNKDINFNYNNLSPFKWFVLENFPFIEAQFDALTNWQLFCKLGKEMNKIINSVNASGEQVETLTTAFNNLQNYVNNYFDNLDIQEEVNNKLDQMAQSGELTELLTAYLNLKCIYGFNTVEDMSKATNLVDGSFCKTYGRNTLNDGYGQFYKVRQITSSDVVDGYNIVALDVSNTLIAEISPMSLQSLRNDDKDEYIIMGDSYGVGYTPDGNVNGWCSLLQDYLNIQDKSYIIAKSGAGFVDPDTFISLLKANIGTIPNKNYIKKIIVCGGYNDKGYTVDQIAQAIQEFSIYCNEQFPNAKIYIGMLGWSTDPTSPTARIGCVQNAFNGYFNYTLQTRNCIYLNGVELILHNSDYMSSDHFHPNQDGQNALVRGIAQALENGYTSIGYPQNRIEFTPTNTPKTAVTEYGIEYVANNNVSIYLPQLDMAWDTPIDYSGNNRITLGTYKSKFIQSLASYFVSIPTMIYVIDDKNQYHVGNGQVVFSPDNTLYVFTMFGDTSGWNVSKIKSLRIYPTSATFDYHYA